MHLTHNYTQSELIALDDTLDVANLLQLNDES